ncbi:MAG: 4-hydroxy-tetrahydrodipicolinate synthase [Firmicutes bacterium]|nr:4-hydroxy-tetrahydrodipicolinate synthase [Bacillota bacterium]
MKKQTIFSGAAAAVITPFLNGRVDFVSLGRIIEFQIANGTDAIVICGTTGESSTLTDKEHRECIRFAVEKTAGRVPVIAGTGSNDTAYAIELSRYACDAGADALLLVTPYYNKATPSGLVRNFTAVADAVNKPIILYNVPSRTGVNITVPVYRELAKHENISAVKEASGNISQIAQLFAECGELLDIYSGNDDQIVPVMSLGGKGVISVLSNVMPRETHDICRLFLEGKVRESAALQLSLLDLIDSLFCEVNPIPVKTAMAELGFCSEEMRLPLCEMEPENRKRLTESLRRHKLLD